MSITDRIYSRDPQHQADDLNASLELALAEDLLDNNEATTVQGFFGQQGPQSALRALCTLKPLAFGLVARFHLEAETSLMGDVEVISRIALDSFEHGGRGLTVGHIGWPNSVLKWDVKDAADEDPERDIRLTAAIEAWKAAHEDD